MSVEFRLENKKSSESFQRITIFRELKIKEHLFSRNNLRRGLEPQRTIMKKNVSTRARTRQSLGFIALSSYLALSSSVSAQQNITVFDDGETIAITPPPAFGFDITRAEFRYDRNSDILNIRLRFDGIAGDVDGDGDPDSGPDDSANFGAGEQIAISFDLNCDATDDFVVGINPIQSFTGTENIPLPVNTLPASTTAVLVNAPSTDNPDFEVQITGWSTVGAHSEQFLYRVDVDSLNQSRDPDRIEGQVNLIFQGRAKKVLQDVQFGADGEPLSEKAEPDVAVQPGSPTGTISGWDIETTEFRYDPVDDIMEVTLNTFGIAGDADGDGNPGSSTFTPLPTQDLPNLEGSETMAVAFDFDGDSTFDIVAGIPAAAGSGIDPTLEAEIALFANSNGNIGQNFGNSDTGTEATAVLRHNPSEDEPDFVMVISHWSQLTTDPFQFGFASFAGSFSDAGVGEESQEGNIALNVQPLNRVGVFDDFRLFPAPGEDQGALSPDVGVPMPPFAPAGTISGWDFKTLDFVYSPISDKLEIDIKFFGIAGDADGDGDPGVLTALSGGSDAPNLGNGETITVTFDLNRDGTEEVVIGVPVSGSLDPDTLELVIAEIGPGATGQNYGTTIVGGASAFAASNPSSDNGDFKIIISGWSLLDKNNPSDFSFRVFAGSTNDGGFGEDNIPNPGMPPQPAVLVPAFGIEEFSYDPVTATVSFCLLGGLEEGRSKLTKLDEETGEFSEVRITSARAGFVEEDGSVTSNFLGEVEGERVEPEPFALYRFETFVEEDTPPDTPGS